MRMMGPIFAAICGVCRRWVDTTDPYLEGSLISMVGVNARCEATYE